MDPEKVKKLFGGKKITLMGLGLLGRGIGDARFFAEAGADLVVTDMKTEAELAPALAELAQFPSITYHLGGHRMEDFENRDLVVRAPNAPLNSPFLAHARAKGVPVAMDASLFVKYSPATIVGVTGSRGKSTTTHLIYEILRAAGKTAFIGGNERGTATLSLLTKARAGDVVVLELDSWQLQGFEEDVISPHIAVWTNFMRDHMNYYHGDMDRYFQDKAAIARFQKPDDTFIAPSTIINTIKERFGSNGNEALKGACIADPKLPAEWQIALPGAHNRANAAYARAAAHALGIDDVIIKRTLAEFKGLPHRLESLGETTDGTLFINDTNATTPDAAIAALATFSAPPYHTRPIVLIAGGTDKALAFNALSDAIRAHAARVILFEGSATEKLLLLLKENKVKAAPPISIAKNMEDAFAQALDAARELDHPIVLLSPGAASFGIFKNEYDRGEQFKTQVATALHGRPAIEKSGSSA